MTDKLTEALNSPWWHNERETPKGAAIDGAARRWRDFPTDDDVEAGAGALSKNDGIEVLDWHRDLARAVLEAVKREDRGSKGGTPIEVIRESPNVLRVRVKREDFDRNVGLGGERMDYGPVVKREDP